MKGAVKDIRILKLGEHPQAEAVLQGMVKPMVVL